MKVVISETKDELGRQAARDGAGFMRDALARGQVNIIVATGASQFEMLQHLVKEPDIDWSKVTAFHLDEYVGMPITHPASFRKYLQERFVGLLPQPIGAFHYISGEGDVKAECSRLNAIITRHPITVAFVGIGENGHLAFNDPPADFEIEDPYIVVELDEACRRQQMGEGWFPTLNDVPRQAISMSIKQIMKSGALVVSVPDERKAKAVKDCLQAPISPEVPASIVRQHGEATLYLDRASASLLPAQIM